MLGKPLIVGFGTALGLAILAVPVIARAGGPVEHDINAVGDAASDLQVAADLLQPDIKDVLDKAILVTNRLLLIDGDIYRHPNEASEYADKLKTLALDQIALGNLISSFSDYANAGTVDCKDPAGKDPWTRKKTGVCKLIIEMDDLAGRLMDDGSV